MKHKIALGAEMSKKKLAERMKASELYFVLNDYDFDCNIPNILHDNKEHLIILNRDNASKYDIAESLPICQKTRTALKRLWHNAGAIVLPLSELIAIFGKPTVKEWADEQEQIAPENIDDYLKSHSPKIYKTI